MMHHWRFQGGFPVRVVARLASAFLLYLAASLTTAQPTAGAEMPVSSRTGPTPAFLVPSQTLDLATCIHLALERQPRIAAQQATLTASQDGREALEKLHFPAGLDPEIPVRRRQAALGVTAAAAGLEQDQRDAAYAVARTYFTVLYAREQERIARGVVDRNGATRDAAQRGLDAGAADLTSADVNRATVYQRLAETRRIQATSGVKRALAALKEAIGLEPECLLDVPPGRLPEPDVRPNRDEVVVSALARRGEMIQAGIFAQVVCLEIEAQGTSVLQRMQTFAAGTDIHARPVPQGVRSSEYRPGAVAPEMPGLLAGNRSERVQHTRALYARAGAMVATTRNLIALEADDAFLRWEEASQQADAARGAADSGDKLANEQNRDFIAGLKVKVDEVVNAQVVAAMARSQYNEFLYQQVLALADLERVTAGGFCAGLVEPTGPRAVVADGAKGK
jgi:outer membrane protein TolC